MNLPRSRGCYTTRQSGNAQSQRAKLHLRSHLRSFFVFIFILTALSLSLREGPVTVGEAASIAPSESSAVIRAFPGAEGFGAQSVGGRGGRVIEVTNLANSGTGSLRACVEASGPRICVFRVGGTITLDERLEILNPFITIAGQTAPGGGITLRNGPSNTKANIGVKASDVIIRYLRFRPGPAGSSVTSLDGIAIGGGGNIIVDHSSVSWGVDENIGMSSTKDVTVQWTIISEALNCSVHESPCHSKGLLGGRNIDRVSLHHNLMVDNKNRNPRLEGGLWDIVNNVIHSTGRDAWWDDFEVGLDINAVGNMWLPLSPVRDEFDICKSGVPCASIYVKGNIAASRPTDDLAEELIVREGERGAITSTRHSAPLVTTTSAQEAQNQVLSSAGASARLDCLGNWISNRDSVDQRAIDHAQQGTRNIIDHPSEVGGWPALAPGTPCTDSDSDGMPDAWENLHGFNTISASDGPLDADGDGYTNLEEYLNGTAPSGGAPLPPPPSNQPPVASAGPDQAVTDFDDNGSEPVTLDGSASTDSDGTISSYVWTEGATQIATGVNPTVTLDVAGSPHTITLTVTDNDGAAATDTVTITVNAATPPPLPISGLPLLLEAENGAIVPPMVQGQDRNASNGAYISVPSGTNSTSPVPGATYSIDMPQDGTYYLWVKLYAPDSSSDAIYIGIDTSWDRVYPTATGRC